MGVIKGVLKEELANSLSLLRRYQGEAEKLKGALVKKKIAGRVYYIVKLVFTGSMCHCERNEVKRSNLFRLRLLRRKKRSSQ